MIPTLVSVMAPKPFSSSPIKGMIREPLPGKNSLKLINNHKFVFLIAIETLCLLDNGHIMVGDSKGIIRNFVEEPNIISNPSTQYKKNARAHGTIKIIKPKDPTSPVLKQVGNVFHSILYINFVYF